MATTEQLDYAIEKAKSKGVECIKVEFEAFVNPTEFEDADGHPCTECCGSGNSKYDRYCPGCDGERWMQSSNLYRQEYFEEFKKKYRVWLRKELPGISELFDKEDEKAYYFDAFEDISVGTELTVTVPISKATLLDRILKCFVRTCSHFGNDPSKKKKAMERAGMHMTFLWEEGYPTEKPLPEDKLKTFKQNVKNLKLALIYLGSVGGKTRSLLYRNPNPIFGGFFDYHEDTCIEFRAFDPCYSNPSLILDNFLVMVHALDFFAENVQKPVKLSSTHAAPDNRGMNNPWEWLELVDLFHMPQWRKQLVEELNYFTSGILATPLARDAKNVINKWPKMTLS